MNSFFQFRIVKDGQVMSVRSPEGTTDLDTALSTISYLLPYDLVSWEKKESGGSRGGLFGGLF